MKGFQSILRIFHIFFSVSCDTEAVIDFSFDTKRIFLFTYDTGSKLTCDSVFFSRGDFLAESSGMSEVIAFVGDHASLPEAIVSYDRQCKIKRCPQNELTAYIIVSYVWTSERFCGQSGHKNFQGGVILICRKLILKQISTKKEINALRSIVEARIFIPRFLRILSSKQE